MTVSVGSARMMWSPSTVTTASAHGSVHRLGSNLQCSTFALEDNAMPGTGCATADLNRDERPDFACTGGTSLKWYEHQPARGSRANRQP
jgi:hypothetical protein